MAVAVAAGLAMPSSAQEQFTGRSLLASSSGNTGSVVVGDVDGDGDLDVVNFDWSSYVGGFWNVDLQLQINDGRGTFTDVSASQLPSGSMWWGFWPHAIALGDVDGDDDLDIIICGGGVALASGAWLYLNDGSGVFTDASTQPPAEVAPPLAMADLDADGDLDIACPAGVYGNDGGGVFTSAGSPFASPSLEWWTCIALGDVDADGDVDVVFGTGVELLYGTGQTRLYTNDGAGTFTDATMAQMPTDSATTKAMALDDVDGDGDADLLIGNHGSQDRLYLNDGGIFTDATAGHLPVDNDATTSVAFGDVDQDGDLDAILAADSPGPGSQVRFYSNDGAGNFDDVTATRMPIAAHDTSSLGLGDLDGDGDLDFVTGNIGQGRVFLNLLRQLDAPTAPTIGQPYQLDVYARYGAQRLFDVALPYVSTAAATIALPGLGTVGIDPAQAIPLPPVLVPQPAGVVSTSVVIPNTPGLVGLSLYAQAMLVPYPLAPTLSNTTLGVVQ